MKTDIGSFLNIYPHYVVLYSWQAASAVALNVVLINTWHVWLGLTAPQMVTSFDFPAMTRKKTNEEHIALLALTQLNQGLGDQAQTQLPLWDTPENCSKVHVNGAHVGTQLITKHE